MKRRTFLLSAPLVLAACGGVTREEILAPQSAIDRVAYVHPGPKKLTLMTMKNTGSDNGAHTGLLINASQRVLWDPAGTFGHSTIPERNDVHFGITPQLSELYISFHSRETFYTLIQELDVTPEVAELAMRLAIANGPTPKGRCSSHTSRMMGQLPGLESIRTSLFPNNLSDQFAQIPSVRSREYRENDSNDKDVAAAEIDRLLTSNQ
jgi:hypothetical protein